MMSNILPRTFPVAVSIASLKPTLQLRAFPAVSSLQGKQNRRFYSQPRRQISQVASAFAQHPQTSTGSKQLLPALARLPTAQLARNIFLGRLLARPRLFQLCLSILRRVANPQATILHPDYNPIVKALVRFCIYEQFCAGENASEVSSTVNSIKRLGYSGVILCPSREITEEFSANSTKANKSRSAAIDDTCEQIESWKQSHLLTLSMIGNDDYMGMKFSGAGQSVFDRLIEGSDPPAQLLEAMDAICQQAASQKSRLWIDAEEQLIQPTIDRWTVDLMRKYNVDGTAILSNTYQAYLKNTPAVLESHIRLSQSEGWSLGIKLVRGAYIGSETRTLIHDTKSETDKFYDMIAEGLITRSFPGFLHNSTYPSSFLVLAGHNADSIHKAFNVYEKATRVGTNFTPTAWAQLQGMADEVGCDLLRQSEQKKDSSIAPTGRYKVYKCLQWGTVSDCMQFLIRRATENNGAALRITDSSRRMTEELRRRIFGERKYN